MRRLIPACAAMAVVLVTTSFYAQGTTPFKLGTFEQGGKPFVGVVVKDSIVVDLAQASAALKSPAAKVPAPSDMKDLITRYDTGVRARIGEILAEHEAARRRRSTRVRPRSEEPEDAPADHVSDDDAECGRELSRACGGDGRSAGGRWWAGARGCTAGNDERAWNLGAQSRTTSDGIRTCS